MPRPLFHVTMIVLALSFSGCTRPDPARPAPAAGHGHAHDHPEQGPHGGVLAEWGDEEFHVEFTVDHDQKETVVYVLDGAGKKAPDLKPDQVAKVTVQITNVDPPLTLELAPDPKRSGEKGLAFSGKHDKLGTVMDFKGQIAGTVAGKHHQGTFDEKGHEHKK